MNDMPLTFAPVDSSQIADLLAWRRVVIENVFGPQSEIAMNSLMAENERYYDEAIPTGEHLAVFALLGGVRVGCGAICFHDELPSPDNPSGRCAYLMNIFVSPEYRRRGIGRQMVLWLVDQARLRGITKIYLESTIEAKPLYRSGGFADLPDMMIYRGTVSGMSEMPGGAELAATDPTAAMPPVVVTPPGAPALAYPGVPAPYPGAPAPYPGGPSYPDASASAYPGAPAPYPGAPESQPDAPAAYPETPMTYSETPAGYPGAPAASPAAPNDAYPGAPAGAYLGAPAGAYPGAPPTGSPGYPGAPVPANGAYPKAPSADPFAPRDPQTQASTGAAMGYPEEMDPFEPDLIQAQPSGFDAQPIHPAPPQPVWPAPQASTSVRSAARYAPVDATLAMAPIPDDIGDYPGAPPAFASAAPTAFTAYRQPAERPLSEQPLSSCAVVSFLLSLLSALSVAIPFIGFEPVAETIESMTTMINIVALIFGGLAVIFGSIGLVLIAKKRLRGRGIAICGLVIGVAVCVIVAVLWINLAVGGQPFDFDVSDFYSLSTD